MSACPFCEHDNPPAAQQCERCGAALTPRQEPGADWEDEVRRLVAEGRKIEAIQVYREATGADLAQAKTAVEALERGSPPDTGQAAPDRGLEAEILSLLRQGRKIEAVKLYRDRLGTGLKEAKDAVEVLAARHGIAPQGIGCLSALLLVAILVFVVLVPV